MRRPALPALVVAAASLLAGCAAGPSQPERVAAVRETWGVTRAHARDAVARIEEVVVPSYPDLVFTAAEVNDRNGTWRPCNDEITQDHWDAPEESYWLYAVGFDVEPRQATVGLVEPLVQSYLADGWTLWRDYRDRDSAPWVHLVKDGYSVMINSSAQHWVETIEDVPAFIDVTVISPCAPAPANLTEWDKASPEDYSFVTETKPEPTW